MNNEIETIKKEDTPEQINKRNKKAVLRLAVVLTIFFAAVISIRYFVINHGASFGSVDGISTQEEKSLTKINFVDSGSSRLAAGTFGSIKSPFTPDFTDKFWIRFNTGEKTIVGYLDLDLKFTKVYELPASIKIVKLLDDNSILFTDEPLKDQPVLYYQREDSEIIKFSALDVQDTFLSIFFDPSEKLIYYLGMDNTNTFFFYSVNEKGRESSLFKTGDLTPNVKIVNVDDANAYFQDSDVCYKLAFTNRKMEQIACQNITKNELGETFTTIPKIQAVYSKVEAAEILRINSNDGSQNSIFALQPNQAATKFSYSKNKLIFVKSALNPQGESIFIPKDLSINILDLSNNQVSELTTKMPNDIANSFYIFGDKFISIDGEKSTKLTYYVPDGMSGQVYVGDVAPVSYTTVTKYWVDIDLGSSVANLIVLNGDFSL